MPSGKLNNARLGVASGEARVGAIILAAGRGSRLNCVDKPKVMCEIGGRPMVSYIVATLKKCGLAKENIYLVVGFHQEKVKEYFGEEVGYAAQIELKGTAHAAFVGMKQLPKNVDTVLVINGDDSAFYSAEAILDLLEKHQQNKAAVSVLSVQFDDAALYGRIIKHADGRIEIIEKEYLTDEQRKINEISSGTFCFNRSWFETMFPNMPPLRKLGEYGLPTALAMANHEGQKVQVIKLKDNSEWFGVNTPAELAEANKRKM